MKLQLPENKFVKTILVIFGSIFVGALGSGFWEIALKPVSITARDIILNIISFSINTFRESIYVTISKGYDESNSVTILMFIVSIVIMGQLISIVFIQSKINTLENKKERHLIDIDNMSKQLTSNERQNENKKSPEQLLEDLSNLRILINSTSTKSLWGMFYSIVGAFVIIFLISLTMLVKIAYVNSAISNYETTVKISKPYVNIDTLKQIDSRFAQIKSKEDYMMIMSKLDSIIVHQGIQPSSFSPW